MFNIPKINFIDGDQFEVLNLDGKITYLKTDSAIELLKKGKGLCPKDHILITHNSDFSITLDLSHQAENTGFPRHWFAQNVLVQDTKITPIPIGLERVRWFPHLHKRDILLDLMGKPDITPSNLCLANFSLSTNYSQRKACLDFCNTFSTVSVDNLVNQKSYISFIESIRDHYFVLCPEGNGIDTHRLWETLYLGRIPVVTNNITIESFKDLPILIIPSWDYLTKDILIKYLNDFQNGKIHYSLNKLDFKYWEKCIKEQINEDFIYPN